MAPASASWRASGSNTARARRWSPTVAGGLRLHQACLGPGRPDPRAFPHLKRTKVPKKHAPLTLRLGASGENVYSRSPPGLGTGFK
jgi:hypothetical protein